MMKNIYRNFFLTDIFVCRFIRRYFCKWKSAIIINILFRGYNPRKSLQGLFPSDVHTSKWLRSITLSHPIHCHSNVNNTKKVINYIYIYIYIWAVRGMSVPWT